MINCAIKYTDEYFKALVKAEKIRRQRTILKRLFIAVATLLVLLLLVFLGHNAWSLGHWYAIPLLVILTTYTLFGESIQYRLACRNLRRSPLHNLEVTFSLSDAGIQRTNTDSESVIKWDEVKDAMLLPDAVCLGLLENQLFRIPFASLTEGTPKELWDTVRRHVHSVREIIPSARLESPSLKK
jgi:hypothetical protein